jgi:hypothetical protein
MRVAYALAAILATSILGFLVFKLLGQARPDRQPNRISAAREISSGPAISLTGPYPKVAVDADFDFGHMGIGETRSHVYKIRNEGAAPLIVEFAGVSGPCGVSDMQPGETREVAPGQAVDIKVTLRPATPLDKTGNGANFNTNDPEHKQVFLQILGIVARRYILVFPEKDWIVPDVIDDKPSVFTGKMTSRVADHFQIIAIECASPLVSAEFVPLAKDKLDNDRALCGYEIRLTVQPENFLGAFRYPLKFKIDLEDGAAGNSSGKPLELEVLVEGVHRGPIHPIGREWNEDKMTISLGEFEASAGKKVKLPLFVKAPPAEGLRLTAAPICTPAAIKVDIERDEKSSRPHERYFLNIEYPAGSPRATYRDASHGTIRLQTNHSGAPAMEFRLYFSAY